MSKAVKYWILAVAVLVAGGIIIWQLYFTAPVRPDFVSKDDLIKVIRPLSGDVISSPLTVEGEARGNWYFEASFPVTLKSDDGNILIQSYIMTGEEWMTTEYVPFKKTFVFEIPKNLSQREGVLILHKDNPSGLPEHDNALEIPVVFGQ